LGAGHLSKLFTTEARRARRARRRNTKNKSVQEKTRARFGARVLIYLNTRAGVNRRRRALSAHAASHDHSIERE
jgi:hypothetical protein